MMDINDKSGLEAYLPKNQRYKSMLYNRCGNSGLLLPAISLGLWHNFGSVDSYVNAQNIARTAFDLGITHFDLANNYGPSYGSAESNFGKILSQDLHAYRDELIITTKAGFDMWAGPYGRGGSRKYLVSSLEQSLTRMGLEYVDVFYHHCQDLDTPLEESMLALDHLVRSGKALYIGISNYETNRAFQAIKILRELGTPCLVHQACYSMLDRTIEADLLATLESEGVGCIAFSPLAQGMLTERYLKSIPIDSRAATDTGYLNIEQVKQNLPKISALAKIAQSRGQKLSQMAIAWLLRDSRITSVLVGASSSEQLKDNIKAIESLAFSQEELSAIETVLGQ